MTAPADIPARPPSYGRVSLGVVMSAREANLLGNIHGGEIVKLADSTAGVVAHAFPGSPRKRERSERLSWGGRCVPGVRDTRRTSGGDH
jgi:hypothetical protein